MSRSILKTAAIVSALALGVTAAFAQQGPGGKSGGGGAPTARSSGPAGAGPMMRSGGAPTRMGSPQFSGGRMGSPQFSGGPRPGPNVATANVNRRWANNNWNGNWHGNWNGNWRWRHHRGWWGPGFAFGYGYYGDPYGYAYYDAPNYYADDYTTGAAVEDDSSVAYCQQRYRSYDINTQTYLGLDGERHPCP